MHLMMSVVCKLSQVGNFDSSDVVQLSMSPNHKAYGEGSWESLVQQHLEDHWFPTAAYTVVKCLAYEFAAL